MSSLKKTIVSIVLATLWISISEFVRNTYLLNDFWIEHYQNLGLTFPEEPINGAVWMMHYLNRDFLLLGVFFAPGFCFLVSDLLSESADFLFCDGPCFRVEFG